MNKIFNVIARWFAPSIETIKKNAIEKANDAYTIWRIDGKDYIVKDGNVISRECDHDDLLDRLAEFKASYAKKHTEYEMKRNGYL